MKFSVLMSIYIKEKPEYFNRCMESIWDEQTIKPNEIVLVEDGLLTEDLYIVIDEWKNKLSDVLKIVLLEHNLGLGDALNEGIKHCHHQLIARMDTDDIALFDRFEKQLKVFENSNIDVCSSWVSEFDSDENEIISYRKVPEKHDEIISYSKMRNGINHPAVMYKKSAVEKAGGYKRMYNFEDYYLWIRMISNDTKFYNIQEPLVNMRAGYGQLERRSGVNYAFSELKFLYKLKQLNYLNYFEFIKNIFLKFPIRFMPKKFIKYIYKMLRNKR